LRSQFATSKHGRGGRRYQPYVFTEHGALMLASVLNSEKAIQASIQIVRAFVRHRELLATHQELARKLAEMEKKYNAEFKAIFEVIQQLTEPPGTAGTQAHRIYSLVIWISACCVWPPSGGFSRSGKTAHRCRSMMQKKQPSVRAPKTLKAFPDYLRVGAVLVRPRIDEFGGHG